MRLIKVQKSICRKITLIFFFQDQNEKELSPFSEQTSIPCDNAMVIYYFLKQRTVMRTKITDYK